MAETIGLIVVAVLSVTAVANASSTKPPSCKGNYAGDKMVKVGPLCVDVYEASVWSGPKNPTKTFLIQYGDQADNYPCNDNGNDCSGVHPIYAHSVAGVQPSRYITWFQAQQACAMSGKRLLTNAEWQMAAAGTVDTPRFNDGLTNTKCNTDSTGVRDTSNAGSTPGGTNSCISNWGVEDMVGNVAEWVADWIQGDVSLTNTGQTGASYNSDLMVSTYPAFVQDPLGVVNHNFPAALVRGGSHVVIFPTFGTKIDTAGVFSLHANMAPSFSDPVVAPLGLGFRCAR